MSIVSSAAEVEESSQLTFKGEWAAGTYLYASGGSTYAEAFISLITNNTVDYFKSGHSYNVAGLIRSYLSTSNIDLSNYSVHVYFVSGDEKVLVYSSDSSWKKSFDFGFNYWGGDVGFLYCVSFTNKDKASVGRVFPSINISDEYPLIFTDLGESVYDSDILKRIDETTTNTDRTMKEVDETTKGIWGTIKEFFGGFFQNLIDSVIHLFVPTKEEMAELLGRLNDFFAEKFGFLYYPFEFMARLFDALTNFTSKPETTITFPSFSIMGYQVWDDIKFDFNQYAVVVDILTNVRRVTGVFIVFSFINYLRDFFEKRFGGGGR